MKRKILYLLTVVFLLTGCGSSTAAVDTEPIPEDLIEAEWELDNPNATTTFDYQSVPMQDVTSTMLAEVGYDPDHQVLLLRFRSNGSLYSYDDVPQSIYDDFMASDSLGSYFNSNIKGIYESTLIESAGNYEAAPLYDETDYDSATYVLNTGTGKFHKKDCRYADAENIAYVSNTKDELKKLGYEPCKVCKP